MRWYRRFFRREITERQLDAELRFHLDQKIADLVRTGLDPEEARRRAQLDFGGLDQVKEECRDVGGSHIVESLIQDLRYGLRQLRRSPGFTAVAVLTLALGIGANTAIFSVMNAVLFNPLPFARPNELVLIKMKHLQDGAVYRDVSYPDFLDWDAENHVFANMALFRPADGTLTDEGQPMHVVGQTVSANLFALLGAGPIIGRTFLPDEDKPGGACLPIILSYRLWRGRFSSDLNILGRLVELDGRPYAVIGVMPEGFQFPIRTEPVEFWRSTAADNPSVMADRGDHYTEAIARLKAKVTLEQAQAEMSTIQGRLGKQYPKTDSGVGVQLVPEIEDLVGNVRPALWVLLGAVGFVLLIACANVANLLLAREATRKKEIVIRRALGAARSRIIRQLLTESMLLAVCGAGLGVALALVAVHTLGAFGPRDVPRLNEVTIDSHVLVLTLALSVAAGFVFGLAPAARTSKASLTEDLKGTGRESTQGRRHYRAFGVLVVVELALALVLLTGAGLLINSFARLLRVDPGFNPEHVLTLKVDEPGNTTHAQRVAFFRQLLARVRALPGVNSASAAFSLPLSGIDLRVGFDLGDRGLTQERGAVAQVSVVNPNYFETMGIPLISGRTFADRDETDGTPVAIINQALARRFFSYRNPIGQRIEPGLAVGTSEPPMREIVGVVGDVRSTNLESSVGLQIYIPEAQLPFSSTMTVVVRTSIDPQSLTRSLERAVHEIDPGAPVYDVKALDQYLSAAVARPRLNTMLLATFGAFALVIGIVGIYGVISYSVAQRTREMGIRMALGAQKGDVLKLVVGHGSKLILTGVGFGIFGAFALTRFLSTMLFVVKPTDPVTFIAVSLILSGVALLASYLPARRATKVDPMVALRYE